MMPDKTEEMIFLSHSAFGKENGVTAEAVRLWVKQGRVKDYKLISKNGVVNSIILKGTKVVRIPEGWVNIYDWIRKKKLSECKVLNALYTGKLKFAKNFFSKTIVPEYSEYPKIKRGNRGRKVVPGYISILKWCDENKKSLHKMLHKNFKTPNSQWVYKYDYFYVPLDWDGVSGFNAADIV